MTEQLIPYKRLDYNGKAMFYRFITKSGKLVDVDAIHAPYSINKIGKRLPSEELIEISLGVLATKDGALAGHAVYNRLNEGDVLDRIYDLDDDEENLSMLNLGHSFFLPDTPATEIYSQHNLRLLIRDEAKKAVKGLISLNSKLYGYTVFSDVSGDFVHVTVSKNNHEIKFIIKVEDNFRIAVIDNDPQNTRLIQVRRLGDGSPVDGLAFAKAVKAIVEGAR